MARTGKSFSRLSAGVWRTLCVLTVSIAAPGTPVHGQTAFPFSIQGKRFLLNGNIVFPNMLSYQPLEPGQQPGDQIRASRVQDDLRRLRAYRSGSDPVLLRVYAQPTAQNPSSMPKVFYDGIRDLGFWIVRDILFEGKFADQQAGGNAIDAVIAEVETAGALDRIFAWEIGDEFQASRPEDISELEGFLEAMVDHIKAEMAKSGRESYSNWVTWASWPPSDPLRTDGNPIAVPMFDYVSFNAYSYDPERMREHQSGPVTGTPYAGYLTALSDRVADKPLVVSESGDDRRF